PGFSARAGLATPPDRGGTTPSPCPDGGPPGALRSEEARRATSSHPRIGTFLFPRWSSRSLEAPITLPMEMSRDIGTPVARDQASARAMLDPPAPGAGRGRGLGG